MGRRQDLSPVTYNYKTTCLSINSSKLSISSKATSLPRASKCFLPHLILALYNGLRASNIISALVSNTK